MHAYKFKEYKLVIPNNTANIITLFTHDWFTVVLTYYGSYPVLQKKEKYVYFKQEECLLSC